MGRTIEAAMFSGATAPYMQNYGIVAAQTFLQGTPLVYSGATGNVIAATAPITTAIFVAISAEPAFHQPGYQLANADVIFTPVTYALGRVAAWVANSINIFSGKLQNGSYTAIAPVVANINVNYGLAPYNNNFGKPEWGVDTAVTGASACVEVIRIDTFLNIVFFKVLAARLAQP